MTNLPPPEPPRNSEQFLHELVNYYRALLNYHQSSAAFAASSLAHVEALLSLGQPTFAPPQQTTLELMPDNGMKRTINQPSLEQPEAIAPSLPSFNDVELILNANRGKMLHLDYIVRILCGRMADKELNLAKQVIEQLLEQGASQGKWYAVPDSPDCWTIDLREFPELAPPRKSKYGNRRGEPRLPANEILDRHKNLTAAIKTCLEENAKPMTINSMLDWFYPDGLLPEQRKRARQAIRDVVIKKCGQIGCWKRFATGLYISYPDNE
jgi:hypothetical protein